MSLGLGEIFSLSCAVCWAIAIILFKHSGETLSANSLNLFKNILGVLLLIPTAIVVEGFAIPDLNLFDWMIVLFSGYIGIAVADSWYFQALRNLGAGRTAIVASLYSPFVILLSIILLDEILFFWQWFGFLFVIAGILLVVYQKHYKEIDKSQLYKGIAYAASSVFLTALGVVMVKPVLEEGSFFWIVSLRLLAGVVGMFLYLVLRKRLVVSIKEFSHGQHNWVHLIIASIFATYLAMILWLAGFKYTDASVASVLNETANVFIVLLAWLLLGEELNKRKLLGVALTFIGVVIFIGVFNG